MKRLIFILLTLFVLSCSRVDLPTGQEQCGEIVSVMLSFEIEDMDGNTKAVVDGTSNSVTDLIKNFLIVQYDGVDDGAKVIGDPKYYPDMETFLQQSVEGGEGAMVKIVSSGQKGNTIVIIANTFDENFRPAQGTTLAELKNRSRKVAGTEDFLSAGSDGLKYMVFSGSVQQKVYDGAKITCPLRRNVAKVDLKIKKTPSNIKLQSWQLRSVPEASYYLNSHVLEDGYSGVFPVLGSYIDYPLNELSQVVDKNSDYIVEETVYLPVNKRGTVSQVANEAYKNYYAPDGATYLQVNATYTENEKDYPVIYSFYLGKDMLSDFNLLPNNTYSYTFDLQSKGDWERDSRVSTPELVDYANTNDEASNCYIINPPSEGLRSYRIPVKRVDEFWDGRYGYEDVPDNVLGTTNNWSVEIIASDIVDVQSKISFTKQGGQGSYNASTGDLQYFEFTVAPEVEGNVIIALRRLVDNAPILWSWHLWITEYSPNEAEELSPQNGVYAYKVSGGFVHRYEGTMWRGEYANRFIMDRNLGSPSPTFLNCGNGALYYQFGRKDPFFGQNSTGFIDNRVSYDNIPNTENDPAYTVKYSIYNPLTYIGRSQRMAWTENNKYNPEDYDPTMLWQDPYTSTLNNPAAIKEKSIFDPCPPGYCIPKRGTWSDFRSQEYKSGGNIYRDSRPSTNITLTSSSEMKRGFPGFYETKDWGTYYWPYEDSNENLPKEIVYYPCTGFKEGRDVSSVEFYLYSMSANDWSQHSASCLTTSFSERTHEFSLNTQYSVGKNLGMPVRCITSR